MDEKLKVILEGAGINTEGEFELKYHTDALIHRLTDIIRHLAANQIVRKDEYVPLTDEELAEEASYHIESWGSCVQCDPGMN